MQNHLHLEKFIANKGSFSSEKMLRSDLQTKDSTNISFFILVWWTGSDEDLYPCL